MIIDAASAAQVVERLDELAALLEHGQFARATVFARELQREASARLYADGFEGDEDDEFA